MATVNGREHLVTRRAPDEMLAEEHARPHPLGHGDGARIWLVEAAAADTSRWQRVQQERQGFAATTVLRRAVLERPANADTVAGVLAPAAGVHAFVRGRGHPARGADGPGHPSPP